MADQRLMRRPKPVGQPKAAKVVGEGRMSTEADSCDGPLTGNLKTRRKLA